MTMSRAGVAPIDADISIEALRERGFSLHERGDLTGAERAYRELLRRVPHDVEVQHAIAVLAVQTGQHGVALEFIMAVVEAGETSAAQTCLGNALQGLSRPLEALRSYDRAIELELNYAPAHINRGHVLRALGRRIDSLTCFDRTLELWPQFLPALLARAEVLLELSRFGEALTDAETAIRLGANTAAAFTIRGVCERGLNRRERAVAGFDRAISLQRDYAPAHVNRGVTLRELKRFPEALASYEAALALCPDSYEALVNRATVLLDLKRLDDALIACDRVMAAWPDRAGEVYLRRAAALIGLERMTDALDWYDKVIGSRPDCAEAHAGRAHALQELGRSTEALTACETAIALMPGLAYAHFIRGVILREQKRPEEALASLTAASTIDPDDAVTNFAIACLCLSMGRFESGWSRYHWGAQAHGATAARRYPQPLWRGKQDLCGKTLYVYADQGLGDTLQLCRYAKLAEARGARVALSVQNGLRRLLRGLSSPTIRVLSETETPPAFDFHCPLSYLPGAFGTTPQTVPALVPYLHAEPERIAAWRSRLGTHGHRIGICWQGSRLKTGRGRAYPLAELQRIAAIPGVRLISLQKLDGLDQLGALPAAMMVEELGLNFDAPPDQFLDTAAVMENLDLVITCDTSIAHLAGALARPTWVVLQFVPDWRWMLDRTDSLWYPTHRLFRQTVAGRWRDVFDSLYHCLMDRLSLGREPLEPLSEHPANDEQQP